jgi:hypothetical protein
VRLLISLLDLLDYIRFWSLSSLKIGFKNSRLAQILLLVLKVAVHLIGIYLQSLDFLLKLRALLSTMLSLSEVTGLILIRFRFFDKNGHIVLYLVCLFSELLERKLSWSLFFGR